MAAMVTDYFHHDARYEIESVEYCDNALAVLQRRRFDLILVLSLHVPWTMRPSSYSATWRIDFANAILFLKHLRALHSPPPGNPHLRESARGGEGRGSGQRGVRLYPQTRRRPSRRVWG